jgi:hypothetical protein
MCPNVNIVKQGESMAQRSLGVKYENGNVTEKGKKEEETNGKWSTRFQNIRKKGNN